MEFLSLVKQRCTTRSFLGDSVPPEKLKYILEAARSAPSACNKQPQRIVVVRTAEGLKKVEAAYPTFGAPCALVICQDKSDPLIRPYDKKCSGDLDIGIVCDHIMLAAREVGLGSVMIGLFDPAVVREGFGIPNVIEPTALMLLGYPKGGFLSPERHDTERKPLEETVCYENYGLEIVPKG